MSDTELLRIDLCGRLCYGIYVKENREDFYDSPTIYTLEYHPCIDACRPYLRPMSSMTEEEKRKYIDVTQVSNHCAAIDYLNVHYFDYRGLIEKGLALEAPKDMYTVFRS